MKDFPVLETERLRLRAMRESDFPLLLERINFPATADNTWSIPHPFKEEDARKRFERMQEGFREKKRYVFAITLKGVDEVIGEVGLHLDPPHRHAEIGYWMGEDFSGKGYMKEAARELLRFGLEDLKLHKVIATHFVDNPASGVILERIGMKLEGELRDHYYWGGRFRTIRYYGAWGE